MTAASVTATAAAPALTSSAADSSAARPPAAAPGRDDATSASPAAAPAPDHPALAAPPPPPVDRAATTSAAAAPLTRAHAEPIAPPTTTLQLGSARAAITVGEGADRIAVTIAASAHHVRVTAETASTALAAAIHRGAGELRDALGRHGLTLAELSTGDRSGGAAHDPHQRDGAPQEPPRPSGPARADGDTAAAEPTSPAARAGLRVLA